MVTRSEAEKEAAEIAGINPKEIVLMTKFSPVPFAERIISENSFVYDRHKTLWRYEESEGLWIKDAEQFIRTELRKNLMGEEQQKKQYVDEIIHYIKDFTYDKTFEMNVSKYLIAFKNKVYDIQEGEFYPHNKDFYLSNKLDLEIDENITECPIIDKFFADCVGEEHKQMLYDLVAYTLFRDMPYQKLFFIYGPASTGKSKFMEFIERFLGERNCCSVEPRKIQEDKHSTARMQYKLANIVSDINYDDLDNINQVKKLSGGDTITIRPMYKDPYEDRIYAKQIYSTNKLPIVKEKTKAWYRRIYLIEFSNIITAAIRDPFLLDKLTSPQEMKGLAFKCLQVLKELYENNFMFTFTPDEDAIGELYESLSSPLLMFIKENCIEGQGEYVYKYDFFERANVWMKSHHFPPLSKSELNQYMLEKYYESNRKSFNGEKTYRVWAGLRWKTLSEPENLNAFNHFNGVLKRVYIHREKFVKRRQPLKALQGDSQLEKKD